MRFAIAVFVSTLVLAGTEPQSKKKEDPPPQPIKRLEIPKGAVEREPNRFYYTDPDGKKWIYTRTPFGNVRQEDKPADPNEPKPDDPLANVKVIEEGDIVKFERPGPFGVYKWQKKKSELDEQEKDALRKAQEKAAKQDK